MAFGVLRNIHTVTSGRFDRCIGKPFRWMDLEIFCDDGEPAGVGQVGRLGVKSRSVTAGYWNDSLTSEKSRWRGYWLTGDLVYRDAEGTYFHVDRTVDKIFAHGCVAYSVQVEEAILKNFGEIFDCSVVESRSDDGAARIAVAAELSRPDVDRVALENAITQLFQKREWPALKTLTIVESDWNEGPTGKKLKRIIREQL
jgi:acyl-coenzyme A synthetase/AMP-(fatty) acid ligase